MSARPLTVLKFGSSLLSCEGDLPAAAAEIARWTARGDRVIAVVSAIGKTTDALLAAARSICADPDPASLSFLLSTGESRAAALLALALGAAGISAALLDPMRIGLKTVGPPLDSVPCGLDTEVVLGALGEARVAVVPGFFGRGSAGEITVLGRGGSDLTALFLADRLGASRCRLLKNVDGVHERDPASFRGSNIRYAELGYEDALRLRARVVQEKALRFAKSRRLRFEVGAPGMDYATVIGPGRTRASGPESAAAGDDIRDRRKHETRPWPEGIDFSGRFPSARRADLRRTRRERR